MVKSSPVPREEWLENGTHDQWAEAVMRCQTSNPYCGSDGRCHLDGECFEFSPREMIEQAERLLGQVERIAADLRAIIQTARKDGDTP